MQLKIFIFIGAMLLLLNGCTMGAYKHVASECNTKSELYKNSPKKECYCLDPKKKACPCEESKGYILHAYERD